MCRSIEGVGTTYAEAEKEGRMARVEELSVGRFRNEYVTVSTAGNNRRLGAR